MRNYILPIVIGIACSVMGYLLAPKVDKSQEKGFEVERKLYESHVTQLKASLITLSHKESAILAKMSEDSLRYESALKSLKTRNYNLTQKLNVNLKGYGHVRLDSICNALYGSE